MVEAAVAMKITIHNNLDLTLKLTHSSGLKEASVIIALSTLKDFGVNMLAHPIKQIFSEYLILHMK